MLHLLKELSFMGLDPPLLKGSGINFAKTDRNSLGYKRLPS